MQESKLKHCDHPLALVSCVAFPSEVVLYDALLCFLCHAPGIIHIFGAAANVPYVCSWFVVCGNVVSKGVVAIRYLLIDVSFATLSK